MKAKQIILLFLALLLPVCIFLFLKGFGKNEFSVPPLFQDEFPAFSADCNIKPVLPYHLPDSMLNKLDTKTDSIALVFFSKDGTDQKLSRVKEAYENFPLGFFTLQKADHEKEMKCIYLLKEPFDVALVDGNGRLRGHYNSTDRDEIDRLLMELAIIFKKY